MNDVYNFVKNISMRKLSMDELSRIGIDDFKNSAKTPILVVLDNIRSQNNIGSVFRTADAFRIEAIYLCGITATPPHREIHKTALGATDSVDWKYFETTEEAINTLKNKDYKIYAVEQIESSIKLNNLEIESNERIALVFGNEINGVNEEILPLCDNAIEIPQIGTKHSLNMAVSAGIVLWELFSKYQKKGVL